MGKQKGSLIGLVAEAAEGERWSTSGLFARKQSLLLRS